jgi:hypothetical protein
MTCEQWHAADKSVAGFEAMTGAERSAVVYHSSVACPACKAFLASFLDEVQTMPTYAEDNARMKALHARDILDPECLEVLEGGES